MPAFSFGRRTGNTQSSNDIGLDRLEVEEVRGSSYVLSLKDIYDDPKFEEEKKKKDKKTKGPLPLWNEDIVYLILEHVYFDKNLRPEYKHLTQYALVNSAWRVPAQTLLFHEVSVKDEKAFKCFERLFSSHSKPSKKSSTGEGALVPDLPHRERLRSNVRVLNYWIYKLRGLADLTNHWESRFPVVMSWFPHLYELRLGVDMLARLQDKTINMLNTAKHSPSIRALQIAMRSDEYGNKPTASTLPFQLITAVTKWKLEYLVMRGEPFNLGSHTDFPPVPHQLIEFRWAVNNSDARPEVDGLITYVTADSTKTLEALSIPSPTHPLITKIIPTIKSLKVNTSLGLPRNLHGLKELIIQPAAEPLPADATFYTNLPKQLVHFGFVCNVPPTTDALSAARSKLDWKIKTFSLYSVQIAYTSYYSYTTTNNATVLQTFVDGLNKDGTGAHVRTFFGPDEMQVGLRSDLIKPSPVIGFPRGVTVENMRLRRAAMQDEEKKGSSGGLIGGLKAVGTSLFHKQPSTTQLEETAAKESSNQAV
ncbi:hypothetical protein FRC15_005182 [Serendipita sp. 397]|nr:hypothetical protein FRC15_005182 [Serendipita sp. 397]